MVIETMVAVAQLEHRSGKDHVTQAVAAITEAAKQGAGLIAFPEAWLPGYPAWLDVCPGVSLWDYAPTRAVFRRHFEQSITVPGPETTRLCEAAAEGNIAVVMELVPTFTERLLWGPGDARCTHGRNRCGSCGRIDLLGALDATRTPGAARVRRANPRQPGRRSRR